MKKLTYLFLALIIVACSSDDSSSGDNSEDYSESCLYTLEVTNITGVTATLNGGKNTANCDSISIINQGFVYATTIQPTINDNQVNVNGTSLSTNIENLNLGTTYYVRTFLTYDLGEIYGNEVSFSTPSPFYLADNGVTIKAYEWAEVGDTGVINGVTYTVVDEQMLRNGFNTNVVTTRVTDMSNLFYNADGFNQPIGNWDVSNVTNMSEMFHFSDNFNQPIGDWDVSNVTNMNEMLSGTNFNQPIGNWDVSNVNSMFCLFCGTPFNQDVSSWDVSNVLYMDGLFGYTSAFNQDLSSWNVSNVSNMFGMFTFANAFNQDLSSWDVSNVTDMSWMFQSATVFNQDISSWSVDGVTECQGFNYDTPQWTLPQPNFTNCTP
jgi:surface protein